MPDNPFPVSADARIPLEGTLSAHPPEPTRSALDGGGGPLAALGGVAETMQKFNALKLFQQTFAAKQKMGQILATSPDMESGWDQIMRDPQVAPFAGEALSAWRGAQLALTQQQGEQQKQATDAFHGFVLQLPRLVQDPGQWNSMVSSVLSTTPRAVQGQVAQAMDAMRTGLTSGLPKDPEAARDEFTKRLSAMTVTLPGGSDAIKGILSTPETKDVGGKLIPGMTAPPQGGIHGEAPGSFTPSGEALEKSLAPQFLPGTPAVVGGKYGLGGEGLGSGAAVNMGLAGTGKPLVYDPEEDGRSPTVGKGASGLNILSPAQQKGSEKLMEEWTGDGQRSFQNAQTTMGLLDEMDRDFDTMQQSGGFLVPGAAGHLRSSLATYANTLAQMTESKELPFDAKTIGSIENMMKDTKRLGLSVLTTMLGNQREAAQTITSITGAVPNVENTYLGGKLLIGSIRAATQRAIDQRNFENAWQADPKNQGNLTGAAEAFNKKYPATHYADTVLDAFGLDKIGFKSAKAVVDAYNSGWITKQQAQDIAKAEGFSKGK